jgi:hypothetical protein
MDTNLDDYLRVKKKILMNNSVCKTCKEPIKMNDKIEGDNIILSISCCKIHAKVELKYADNYDIDKLNIEVNRLKKKQYIETLLYGKSKSNELNDKSILLNKLQEEKQNKISSLEESLKESQKIIDELELSLYTSDDIDTLRRVLTELQNIRVSHYALVEEIRKY